MRFVGKVQQLNREKEGGEGEHGMERKKKMEVSREKNLLEKKGRINKKINRYELNNIIL